jgi:uncharacterized protein (TIGR03437 family)
MAYGQFPGVSYSRISSTPLPTQVQGVQVLLGDHPAPLLMIESSQIEFQVPGATPPGEATIRVLIYGEEIASATAQIAEVSPGLLLQDFRPHQPGLIYNQDWSMITEAARAVRGQVVHLIATGGGRPNAPPPDGAPAPAGTASRTLLAPEVYVGADKAVVLGSHLSPVVPGVWQIDAVIPERSSLAGQVPVYVVLGGRISNGVTFWITP